MGIEKAFNKSVDYYDEWIRRALPDCGKIFEIAVDLIHYKTSDQINESFERRKKYDIDATMEEQLQWLREAGFAEVYCIYKNFSFGIFFALK